MAAMATTRFMHRSRDHTCSNAFLGCFIALNSASGKGLRAVYRFTVYGPYTSVEQVWRTAHHGPRAR